ncbi:MAG: tetratricopeptide repeat protein [Opitutae bacterium]|nr:tetratricopeptide repeat protein [Opitutae bacterium]
MRLLLLVLLLVATAARAAVSPEKLDAVRRLLRERKLAEASFAAQALVIAHPGDAAAHAVLGRVQVAQGDADVAVKSGEKAVELEPGSSELHCQLGDTYGFAAQKAGMLGKVGWAKKCRLAYEKAVELDPANLDARSSLMGFYQMAPGVMGGGVDKAYAQAAGIKKLDANRGRIAYAMLYVGKKRFTEAFTELEELLEAAPDNCPALYQFGRAAALSGEHLDRGIETLHRCLAFSPTPGSPGHEAVHWRLGNLHEKKGDTVAARAAYQASLAIRPDYQPALDSLGKLQ